MTESREENWLIRATYHKQKAQEYKDRFAELTRRCYRDPTLRSKADAEWAAYEKHRDRADYFFQKSIEELKK